MRQLVSRIPGARGLYRNARSFGYRFGRHNYPARGLATHEPNWQAVEFVRDHGCRRLAEVGCYRGDTTLELARVLGGEGFLHVFDFEDHVANVLERLRERGLHNISGFSNSRRTYDSYNWSLMRLLQTHSQPLYDYVLLDGAHTWPHDALAFLLVDRLLVPGGFVHFDDYDWTLATSPVLRPEAFPPTARQWTEDQVSEPHVRLIVDLLVRRDEHYVEVVPNSVFRRRDVE